MAPLDEPPTASSSEEEESSSEEVDTSSDENDDEPSKPQSPIPPISAEKTPPAAKASSSDSETESDSNSETEEDRPDPKIKPISSKPIGESSKSKKPTTTPVKSTTTKRPSENDRAVSDSKRAKKGKDGAKDDVAAAPEAEDDGTKAKADSKKLFQRIWSDDDEIALLNGMLEFSKKTGGNPNKDVNAFHDFIKEALHLDVSNDQLYSKIRRLKKKYENIKKKRNTGKEYNPSKPHDKKAYELSKKVWATAEGEENGGTEMPKPQQSNGNKERKNQNQKFELEKAKSDNKSAVGTSFMSLAETILFERSPGLSLFDGETLKKSFELIEASKRAELEDQWKKLQIAELELFVRRSELVKEQAALVWEAYKSSSK